MELFGADLDDDLFETKVKAPKVQNPPKSPSTWVPLICEPEWFNENTATINNEQGQSSFIFQQHIQAHHLYYTGRYAEATIAYSELLTMIPSSNTMMRREISDGLSRSHLKAGKYDCALLATKELEKTCKNKWQFAGLHSLIAEIYNSMQDFEKELKHLQSAIMVHQLNSDLWLRISKCYHSMLSSDDIFVEEALKLSKKADSSWHAAASLIRALTVLKSVSRNHGRGTTFGKARILSAMEKLQPVIASLPFGFVSKAEKALSRDIYSVEQQRENTEFEDLGSSKYRAAANEEEEGDTQLENQWFESHWFAFENTIGETDLYLGKPHTQTIM